MADISTPSDGSLPHRPSQPTSLPSTAKPPKSKTEPYYAIHPLWTDVNPIPQLDLDQPTTYTSGNKPLPEETAKKLASAGPALATIAYTPRYVEAMSYLRAVMAQEEYSERALGLTEDIISMNPAHYTVWIYRFRILRELWGSMSTTENEEEGAVNEKLKTGLIREMKWLEKISEKNLKNYQIWHHRQSLFQLLPISPPPTSASWVEGLLNAEPVFLRAILELDTKNYHVWSYRQWLCARFSHHFLLDNSKELEAINVMIEEDVMNNSAWNHRYFIVFGAKQNIQEQKTVVSQADRPTKDTTRPDQKLSTGTEEDEDEDEADIIDLDVVDRELDYVKNKIRDLPQNGSTWNYLKGILKYADIPVTEMKQFCSEFVGEGFTFDILDGGQQNQSIKGVRSSQAVEMCVEIFAAQVDIDGLEEDKDKVRQGLDSLGQKWDPIRKRYWDWRLKRYEQKWKE